MLRGRSGWVNSAGGARMPCSGSEVISSMDVAGASSRVLVVGLGWRGRLALAIWRP